MTKDNDYKLVALDLDGTLISDDLVISDEVKTAIREAVAQGVVVTLATGRMFSSARQFADELGLSVPLICYQGAMVRHSITEETIYHQPIPYELAREFLTFTQKRGYYTQVYVDDHMYVPSLTEEALYYSGLARVPAQPVGDLMQFIDRPERAPTKLVIVTAEERTLAVLQEMQAAFSDRLYVTRSHPRFTEGVNPACSKGAALAALALALDIPREKVIAIGDNLNDLPMLEWAGLGIGVANAGQAVKETAGYVTHGAISAGVIEALQKFVLK